ncbi:hypothetical protein WJX74_006263 [Apatococcus lobatus]|uniref:Uncharacterized protein n=1 Tax=Apatococcus lobatus TaxID=904363 RepID=A0AAW1RPN7_9CHLO
MIRWKELGSTISCDQGHMFTICVKVAVDGLAQGALRGCSVQSVAGSSLPVVKADSFFEPSEWPGNRSIRIPSNCVIEEEAEKEPGSCGVSPPGQLKGRQEPPQLRTQQQLAGVRDQSAPISQLAALLQTAICYCESGGLKNLKKDGARQKGVELYRPMLNLLQQAHPMVLPKEDWPTLPSRVAELCSQHIPSASSSQTATSSFSGGSERSAAPGQSAIVQCPFASANPNHCFASFAGLTVEQLLVSGLLGLKQQEASIANNYNIMHAQPTYDAKYLLLWQEAVERFASEELKLDFAAANLHAESSSGLPAGWSAAAASDHPASCAGYGNLNGKRRKLRQVHPQIRPLNLASETACRSFAATIWQAMQIERQSGRRMFTSSPKIWPILQRCSRCKTGVAAGITGAHGSCNRDSAATDESASRQLDIRCWSCFD